MKLLLDENLPKKLKIDLLPHEAYTVSNKKWNGIKNGELLKLMLAEDFEVLLTFDRNIQYQQNFQKYPIAVLVLVAADNTYETLRELVPDILEVLSKPLQNGATEIKKIT